MKDTSFQTFFLSIFKSMLLKKKQIDLDAVWIDMDFDLLAFSWWGKLLH